MPAPGPAAGTPLAFFQLLLGPADAPLSGRRLLGVLDPTDELVARQRRDVIPRSQSRGVGDQRVTQVGGQPMHHPAGHLAMTHRHLFSARISSSWRRWINRGGVHYSTPPARFTRNSVGEGGLEPPRPEGHWHLKPARLPFRHSPETTGGPYHCSSRTPQPPPAGHNPWRGSGLGRSGTRSVLGTGLLPARCFLRILTVPLRHGVPIACFVTTRCGRVVCLAPSMTRI